MRVALLKSDSQASVLELTRGAESKLSIAYSAFGHQRLRNAGVGFVGQYLEGNGLYILGNGARGYLPRLERFVSADAIGPFIPMTENAYAYSLADPINRTDPSGRISLPAIVRLVVKARRWAAKVRPVTSGTRYRHFIEDGQAALLKDMGGKALKNVDKRYSLPSRLLEQKLETVTDKILVRQALLHQLATPDRKRLFASIYPSRTHALHAEKTVLELTGYYRKQNGIEIGNWIG